MGFGAPYLGYLSKKELLKKSGTRILDIGSQCLLGASPEDLRTFLENHGKTPDDPATSKEIDRLSYFSFPRAGERTSYLSELFDLTNHEYTSYDVCPALKTEIFDLNRQAVPDHYRERFDVVLNFGTTEHIINQFNCFKVAHDALAVGGVAIHQLPSIGWIDHGYFCYHLALFRDLANTNDYEILDSWYTPTGTSELSTIKADIRSAENPLEKNFAVASGLVPAYLINVVLRKRSSHAFRLPLELATAHASLSESVANNIALPADSLSAREALPPISAVTPDQTSTGVSVKDIPGRVLASELKIRVLRRIFGPGHGMKPALPPAATDNKLTAPAPVSEPASTIVPAVPDSAPKSMTQAVDLSMDAHHHYKLGKAAQDAGNYDDAFNHYRRALGLIHKYGPVRAEMQVLSTVYASEGRKILGKNDTVGAKRMLVRALELDPENRDAASRLDSIITSEGKRDLTKHCFVFYDPKRAEMVHREAVLRCLEYVSIAGVVGDVLEFGVLAGWSSRIFCESIRTLMSPADMHLFDSFDGLPDYTSDIDIKSYEIAGRNIWSDKMRFSDHFQKDLGSTIDVHVRDRLSDIISPQRINVYRGFYSDSLKKPLHVKAAIVHIDCDLYQSTVEVLWALHNYNVFQDGCILMFDDWNCNKASPNYGERRAFQEYLEQQNQYTSSPFFTYGFNGAAFFLHDRNA
jgi:hypothetical protein